MQFAVDVPNFEAYADARFVVALARETEAAGLDGLFIWDHMLVDPTWRVAVGDPRIRQGPPKL